MASLPKTATVTYEQWLRMPVTEGREEVVDGEIQIMPAAKSEHVFIVANLVADFMRKVDRKKYRIIEVLLLEGRKLRQAQILTEGILKPKHFPGVQIDISGIWPD